MPLFSKLFRYSTLKSLILFSALLVHFQVLATTKVLILGDSLSAAYGMLPEQGWVALTQQKFTDEQLNVQLVNAAISGETTSGGLARLPALLEQHQPEWVLVELGGNDGLQGYPPKEISDNLEQILSLTEASGSQTALMQIRIPPNYGKRYNQMFEGIYPQLAEANQVTYLPFFIEELAVNPALMMNDGIHPNVDAQPILAETMFEQIKSVLGM